MSNGDEQAGPGGRVEQTRVTARADTHAARFATPTWTRRSPPQWPSSPQSSAAVINYIHRYIA
jgi:hypothetical protein